MNRRNAALVGSLWVAVTVLTTLHYLAGLEPWQTGAVGIGAAVLVFGVLAYRWRDVPQAPLGRRAKLLMFTSGSLVAAPVVVDQFVDGDWLVAVRIAGLVAGISLMNRATGERLQTPAT